MQSPSLLPTGRRLLNVDHIVVMDAGKIVARGTCDELLNKLPLHARLAELQFQNNNK